MRYTSSRDLKLVSGRKFSLVGTPIGKELKDRTEDIPDVMNDLDIDVSEYPDLMRAFANDQRNIRKIKDATETLDIHLMNPPRPGKPLLVLDLDYSQCFFERLLFCVAPIEPLCVGLKLLWTRNLFSMDGFPRLNAPVQVYMIF